MLRTKLRAWRNDLLTPPVVAGEGGVLFLERGDRSSVEGKPRVAIVASWARSPIVSRSLSAYLAELDRCGFATIVVSSSEHSEPLEWPYGIPPTTIVVRRRNLGHDFGSWAAALEAFPTVRSADHVLLTNDSMIGPLVPLSPILGKATSTEANVVALTDSFQIGHSLQSYFMMFNRGVLQTTEWKAFFRGIRHQAEKLDVVFRYELAVAKIAVIGAYGWSAMFSAERVGAQHRNPTLDHWKELLDLGFPFVKRTLWTDPQFADSARQAETYLKESFEIDANAWLPPEPEPGIAERENVERKL